MQTLEPRLLYVNTPFRRQLDLPNFDAFAKDFNLDSIFSENAFSGVDRVSDSHAITAGVTTRILDPQTGVEALRLGIAQRYLFRDQRITADGDPITRRFSESCWSARRRSCRTGASTCSCAGTRTTGASAARCSAFATRRGRTGPSISTTGCRAACRNRSSSAGNGRSRRNPRAVGPRLAAGAGGAACKGTLYGVGRINCSTRDKRLTDGIVGVEYDAGCWIGRLVAERISTGRNEATTRLLVQLELVGLSRIGSNPLKVLKDNIPGYRLSEKNARRRRHSPRMTESVPGRSRCAAALAAPSPRLRSPSPPRLRRRRATTSSPSSTRKS